MRKILYSPGYGAGWSTWHSVPTDFACEYEPIIEALENGEELHKEHPSVIQYVKDCQDKFDCDPYLGGLDNLEIKTISDDDQYQIDVYDGFESVETKSSQKWH